MWGGTHVGLGVAVAVKVLTARQAREPFYLEVFRNEVRAAAGLNHPNIVMLFDLGEVPEDVAASSAGRLVAGSPWLAMEYADAGALTPWCGRLGWSQVRAVLLRLLDALAHAHARGVIHRDIKPPNVLLNRTEPQVRLTDFGLAHAVDRTAPLDSDGPVQGTPAFMAPEQFEDDWRAFGPWTDLYSLGCLAYSMATGLAPFGTNGSFTDLRQAHCLGDFPRLHPRRRVPAAFEGWIRRLVEKDPARRFRWAADAAHALLHLDTDLMIGPPEEEEAQLLADTDIEDLPVDVASTDSLVALSGMADAEPSAPSLPDGALEPFSSPGSGPDDSKADVQTIQDDALTPLEEPATDLSGHRTRAPAPLAAVTPSPVPSDWRRRETTRASPRLLGAGLGLYPVRTVPLVDRERERDVLWSALLRVQSTRKPHAVLLDGPSGCGKSRLAEWLGERAQELGAATLLKAVHSSIPGPMQGLEPMLSRHFRAQDLPRSQVLVRIRDTMRLQGVTDADEWHAMTELVCPSGPTAARGERVIRFGSPLERYAVIRRHLTRLSQDRTVVVWLDDVQWGPDAIAFATHVLEVLDPRRSRILLVLTARDDILPDRRAEARQLDALLRRSEVTHLGLGPLPRFHHAALIRELLGLEGDLAAQVEGRTAGNPLFAVQLVGDWVQRGLLEPGEAGFRLKAGARVDLPTDLHQVWAAQVEKVLERWSEKVAWGLEIAAVLGQEVDLHEWRDVCHRAGLTASMPLLEEMMSRHLFRWGGEGADRQSFAFAHAMLRETLEHRARGGGRWPSWHQACASMLEGRPGTGEKERRGRHLLAAGSFAAAVAPLGEAAITRLEIGDPNMAGVLLAERQRALEFLPAPEGDIRWGEGHILWAWHARLQGDLDQAEAWAARAETSARRFSWTVIRSESLHERGRVAILRGDLRSAFRRFEEAAELAVITGDQWLIGRSQHHLADALTDMGMLERAERSYVSARAVYQLAGDELGVARCLMGLGQVARKAGEVEHASSLLEAARERFLHCGSRAGLAECVTRQGEVARMRGELERAEAFYREAAGLLRAIDTATNALPEAHVGLILVERGQYAAARDILVPCLHAFQRQERRTLAALLHAAILPCVAFLGEWIAMDQHLLALEPLLRETGYVDLDIARLARRGGDIAWTAGERARARDAWVVSRAQWTGLGRPQEAEEIDRLLQGAPAPTG